MIQLTEDPSAKQVLVLTSEEKKHLARITQRVPQAARLRYTELAAKQETNTLTDAEYQELLSVFNRIEAAEVQRLAYLMELAKQRKVSLPELMDSLNLTSPSYA